MSPTGTTRATPAAADSPTIWSACAPLGWLAVAGIALAAPLPVLLVAIALPLRRLLRAWLPGWLVLLVALGPLAGWWLWAARQGLLPSPERSAAAGLQAQALGLTLGIGTGLGHTLVAVWVPAWAAQRGLLLELGRSLVPVVRGAPWAPPALVQDPGSWWPAYWAAVAPCATGAGAAGVAIAHLLQPRRPVPPGPPTLAVREEPEVAFTAALQNMAGAGTRLRHPPDGWAMGWAKDGGQPIAFRGPDERQHGAVAGTTGTGKTNLMKHQICGAVGRHPTLVVDLKGSADLSAFHRTIPGALIWTPGGPLQWSPFAGGVSDFATKLVEAAGTITGEQMNKLSQSYLQWVGRALEATGDTRGPLLVSALLDPAAFTEYLLREVEPRHPYLAWLRAEVALFRTNELGLKALSELAGRVKLTLQGDAMPSLGEGRGPDGGPPLELEAAIRAGRSILFSIDVPALGLAGQCLGAWVLLKLRRVSSRLQQTGWGSKGGLCTVCIDEFSALGPQGRYAVDLLARAREAGLAVWLFTQGLTDLDQELGKGQAQQIINLTRVHVAFKHQSPADREKWSEQFGTYERESVATRSLLVDVDGNDATADTVRRLSARWQAVPYVSPNALRSLPDFYCYVARSGTRHRAPKLDLVLVGRAPDAVPIKAQTRRKAGKAGKAGDVCVVWKALPRRLGAAALAALATLRAGVRLASALVAVRRSRAAAEPGVLDAEWHPLPEPPPGQARTRAPGQARTRPPLLTPPRRPSPPLDPW